MKKSPSSNSLLHGSGAIFSRFLAKRGAVSQITKYAALNIIIERSECRHPRRLRLHRRRRRRRRRRHRYPLEIAGTFKKKLSKE